MGPDEAVGKIVQAVRLTRADVVAAKSFLADAGTGRIDIRAHLQTWAETVSPRAARDVYLDQSDIEDQLAAAARAIVANLALTTAAWELVHDGLMYHAATASWEPTFIYRTPHGAGGLNFNGRFHAVYPEPLLAPDWREKREELWDGDLYLRRLKTGALHPGIEQALRFSLECFRRGLYVPSLAMLGAASEGAWIETGGALAKSRPSEAQASKVLNGINDERRSIRVKIKEIAALYGRTDLFEPIYSATGVSHGRIVEIAYWSDLVREARNVLHWNVAPTVPNSYEKVAILLMQATSTLNALHAVRDAASRR